jgi:putative transposase
MEDRFCEKAEPLPPELVPRRTTPRLTAEQIISVVMQAESGVRIADLSRQYGTSERAIYRWKVRFRGLVRRLQACEEENSRLKRLVADLVLRSAEAAPGR